MSFQFELVSPEKLMVSKPVVMVTVPGGEGEYGVLSGHAPMITNVRAGVIAVYEHDDTTITDRIFVAGGFAETTDQRCTVLAEQAIPVRDLNRPALEAELQTLTASLATAPDSNRETITAAIDLTQAKLNAIAA